MLFTYTFAQQDAKVSHYMYNTMLFNPAFAGSSNDVCATLINRQQWKGFAGAPKTSTLTLEGIIRPFKKKSGLGLIINSDNIGNHKQFNGKIAYSYHKKIWNGQLFTGLNMGLFNQEVTPNTKFPESTEVLYDQDAIGMVFDMDMGTYYKSEKYYLSFSVTHLNQPTFNFERNAINPSLKRHYFLTGGYNLSLESAFIDVLPTFMIKSDGADTQISISTNVTYNKKFWGGVSYSGFDALIFMAGLELKNGIKFGYAYDVNLTALRKATHEVYINYCFNLTRDRMPQNYKSVRFL